jgi:hypothetical protein
MVKRNKIIIFYIIIGSLAITLYNFIGIGYNNFIAMHDSDSFISIYDIQDRIFILRDQYYNGLLQFQFLAPFQSFPTAIVYLIGYTFKVATILITALIYFFIQTFILVFSYFGFYKIYLLYKSNQNEMISNQTIFNILLITLLYFFNPFNIININNGIFFSMSYLSYGSIPLFFYYLLKMIKNKLDNQDIIYFLFHIFFIVLITTYLVPVILASLILIILNTKSINWFKFIRQSIYLTVGTICLTLPVTVPFISQSINSDFISDNLVNSTNSLIKGGLLTPMRGLFHWPLYTSWSPRSIYTFSDYYNSILFILASLSMYFTITIFFIKGKIIKYQLSPYILILLIALFFAKGSNSPFGEIFSYLINNITLFGAVRSPDNKFPVLIPIVFSIILILGMINYKKYINYIRIYILTLIIIFSYPFFTKEAVLSKDEYPKSGSYIFSILEEYKELIRFLNEDKELYRVLSLPESGGYRAYDINKKLFIGRDVISTSTRESLVSYDSTQDEILKQFVLDNQDINSLKYTNIKYILIRKDIFDKKGDVDKMVQLVESTGSQKIIDNQYLTLYKVPEEIFKPKIIINNDINYSFNKINITQYEISIKNIQNKSDLSFLEGFNKNYKLYLNKYYDVERNDDTKFKYFTQNDINILFKKPLFEDSHKLVYDYANQWTIDPEYIKANFDKSMYKENPDGSIDLELTLYFKPQSYFYLGIIISGTTLILCLSYLGYTFYRQRKQGILSKIDSDSVGE